MLGDLFDETNTLRDQSRCPHGPAPLLALLTATTSPNNASNLMCTHISAGLGESSSNDTWWLATTGMQGLQKIHIICDELIKKTYFLQYRTSLQWNCEKCAFGRGRSAQEDLYLTSAAWFMARVGWLVWWHTVPMKLITQKCLRKAKPRPQILACIMVVCPIARG